MSHVSLDKLSKTLLSGRKVRLLERKLGHGLFRKVIIIVLCLPGDVYPFDPHNPMVHDLPRAIESLYGLAWKITRNITTFAMSRVGHLADLEGWIWKSHLRSSEITAFWFWFSRHTALIAVWPVRFSNGHKKTSLTSLTFVHPSSILPGQMMSNAATRDAEMP